MSQAAIEFRGVSKDFKTDFWKPKVRVLESVDLRVEEGTIFGLVGPNGAGKTTAIKMLMGLIRPTEGSVAVFGCPAGDSAIKRQVGYLPENAYYYDYLRTEEVIDFYARLFGYSAAERRRKTDELLELVGLSGRRGVRLRQYSKGMLQRIGIAQAIVNDPKVVIFDEPMSGLDPLGRKEVRDIILRLRDRKKTILFSSHILSDVEALCDCAAILVKGKIRAAGPLGRLVHPEVKSTEIVFAGETHDPLPEGVEKYASIRRAGGETVLSVTDPLRLHDLLAWGKSKGLTLVSVIPQKETLEDLFVETAGRS